MAGKPQKDMRRALKYIMLGQSPYEAALRVGISLSTMYRSKVYKALRDGKADPVLEEIRASMKPGPSKRISEKDEQLTTINGVSHKR